MGRALDGPGRREPSLASEPLGQPAAVRELSLHDTLAVGSGVRVYVRTPTGGIRHGTGLFVLTLEGDRISALTRFDATVLRWFGLPQSLLES